MGSPDDTGSPDVSRENSMRKTLADESKSSNRNEIEDKHKEKESSITPESIEENSPPEEESNKKSAAENGLKGNEKSDLAENGDKGDEKGDPPKYEEKNALPETDKEGVLLDSNKNTENGAPLDSSVLEENNNNNTTTVELACEETDL